MILSVVCIWILIAGVDPFSIADVQLIADTVSHDLTSYSNAQFSEADIQRLFNQFEGETHRIDGSMLVGNISEALEQVLSEADDVSGQLANAVAKHHKQLMNSNYTFDDLVQDIPREKHFSKLRLYYHSSEKNVWHFHPALDVERDNMEYDAHKESRSSGSAINVDHDVIIILDTSMSMNGSRFAKAKEVLNYILKHFIDATSYIAVITSASEAWDNKGKNASGNVTVLHGKGEAIRWSHLDDKYIDMVMTQVNSVKIAGGSDHRKAFCLAFSLFMTSEGRDESKKVLFFISDWDTRDGVKVSCTEGYRLFVSNESKKKFFPGPLCKYDYLNLVDVVAMLQYSLLSPVQIITVLTSETKQFSTERNETDLRQAGRMACDTGGYLCKITTNDPASSIENQLDGLKHFLEPEGVVGKLMVKSGTMSMFDRRPAVSLSRRITHQGPLHYSKIGVASVDIPLSVLESSLMNVSSDGRLNMFLVDQDGLVLVHPLTRPSFEVIDRGQLTSLFDLETDSEGQPTEFQEVLKEMLSGRKGDHVITLNARRAELRHGVVTWVPVNSSHYFYAPLYGSRFIVGLVVHDNNYDVVRLVERDRSTTGHFVQSQRVPTAVTILSPHAFVNMRDFHYHFNVSLMIEGASETTTSLPSGLFPATRSDLNLISTADSNQVELFGNNSLLTLIGTRSGVMRVYRNTNVTYKDLLSSAIDVKLQPWYQSALANKGLLSVTGVEFSSMFQQNIVTLSQALCAASPHQVRQCVVDNNDVTDVIAVIAASVTAHQFSAVVMAAASAPPGESLCNCQQARCQAKCHVMNDLGEFVTSPAGTLFSTYGHIFQRLLQTGLFYARHYDDTMATCRRNDVTNFNMEKSRAWWLDINQYVGDSRSDSIELEPCVVRRTIYLLNRTLLSSNGNMFYMTLRDCDVGDFYMSAVPNTSLLLVVMSYYSHVTSPMCENIAGSAYSTNPIRLNVSSKRHHSYSEQVDRSISLSFVQQLKHNKPCGYSGGLMHAFCDSLVAAAAVISLTCSVLYA